MATTKKTKTEKTAKAAAKTVKTKKAAEEIKTAEPVVTAVEVKAEKIKKTKTDGTVKTPKKKTAAAKKSKAAPKAKKAAVTAEIPAEVKKAVHHAVPAQAPAPSEERHAPSAAVKHPEPVKQKKPVKPAEAKPAAVTAPAEEKKIPEIKKEAEPVKQPQPAPQVQAQVQVQAPAKPELKPAAPIARIKIQIDETITVAALANKMNVKVTELIKKMLLMNIIATINQRIDTDVATLIASEFNCDVTVVPLYGEMEKVEEIDKSKLKPRPPIVTIMGHVDHGKTSILDAIRKTNVAGKEFGGITQHIGAYKVKTPRGEIVFLDTPGHEAFTAMRARGAQVTDIVVLIVAADDGVMPQTIEAIAHAKAANIPIIAAINKIDIAGVNIQKVKQELSNQGLAPEEWGGKTITVEISARKNIGIDKLLELILLQAEILELKANPDKPATGIVVEARLSKGVGPVATVLIKSGTLKVGDYFVAGTSYGKVRGMRDDKKKSLKEAGPATPVEVIGFQTLPLSGDKFIVAEDEKKARHVSEIRQQLKRDERLSSKKHLTLESFHKDFAEGKAKELKLILKADVLGSAEVLRDSLEKLSNKEVSVKIIHSGIGGINDSDVILATASDAIIIGFNVSKETSAIALSQKENVEIKTYRIIYDAINDVKAAMEGLLDPDEKEVYLGRAKILKVFKIEKIGSIAGCSVIDGKVSRTSKVRLLRNNTIIFEGKLSSLKRFKDDAKEVEKGFECGMTLDGFNDIKEGDIVESFTFELVKRKL